jgi:hypothetical protein
MIRGIDKLVGMEIGPEWLVKDITTEIRRDELIYTIDMVKDVRVNPIMIRERKERIEMHFTKGDEMLFINVGGCGQWIEITDIDTMDKWVRLVLKMLPW